MNTRATWVEALERIARPVLTHLANETLNASMPPGGKGRPENYRRAVHGLESVGRTLTGISPWLVCENLSKEETQLQTELRELTLKGLRHAVDPESPDYLGFGAECQHVVDAAFLAHAFLRTRDSLWLQLDKTTQANLVTALKKTRIHLPGYNNWLLFSAMIETFLLSIGDSEADLMRIDYAVRQHEEWYKGDGAYGDGPNFHWDYYNSFVIQPMLLDIVSTVQRINGNYEELLEKVKKRAVRYAEILERMISPEGTYPPIGRSLAYRFGAFQHLSQMAYQETLPDSISPAQVRCGLTAVIERLIAEPSMFDSDGWLTVGLMGEQPELGEAYIGTGSTYLCCAAFLVLGLPPSAEFWSGKDQAWTAKRIFGGEDMPRDHAIGV